MLLVGCKDPAPEEKPILRIGIRNQPVTLDPNLQVERTTRTILGNVYESLTVLDRDMSIRPGLAESWESPFDLTWRFRIREGVLFHDGTVLEVEDVVASLRRAMDTPGSHTGGSLIAVEEIKTIDRRTLELTTREPYPLLANKLSAIAILPRNAPERIEAPIGTGPFRYASPFDGHALELMRWEHYWQEKPHWESLRFVIAPDRGERLRLLRDGEVDVLADLSPDEIPDLERLPQIDIRSVTDLSVQFIGFRLDRPPLDDPRVRRSIAFALDRSNLVNQHQDVATQLVNSHVFGFVARTKPPSHSIERSLSLLRQSGHDAGIELVVDVAMESEASALALREQLMEVGIDLELRVAPFDELYRRLQHGEVEVFMASFGCASGDASDLFDAVLHSREPDKGYGSANFMGYSNPDLDRLIESAATTLHPNERRSILEKATVLALEDLPLLPIYSAKALYAVRSDIQWTPRVDRFLLGTEFEP